MSLVGLVMKHRTPCLGCKGIAVVIGEPKGPHAGSLYCQTCNRHRGWLPKTVADFLTETINHFGSPQEPIEIRSPELRTAASLGENAASEISAPTGTGGNWP